MSELRKLLNERLVNNKDKETVDKCWQAIALAAENYDPSPKTSKRVPHLIEKELRHCSISLRRALRTVHGLSHWASWEIDYAILPKSEMDIPKWGAYQRRLLKSWFEENESKFQELGKVAKALNNLADFVAKKKEASSGRRLGSGPCIGPKESLLFSLASSMVREGRPLVHAKRIGDVIHQWATDGSGDLGLSDRSWRKVERQFSKRKQAHQVD